MVGRLGKGGKGVIYIATYICIYLHNPSYCTPAWPPSPQRRITAVCLCTAFAHIPGEAGTLALGIWSVLLGRKRYTFLAICTYAYSYKARGPALSRLFCSNYSRFNRCACLNYVLTYLNQLGDFTARYFPISISPK